MKKNKPVQGWGNYVIRKHKFYKDYVFLLTAFEGAAYWTTHEYAGDTRAPLGVLIDLFQASHNRQVDFLRIQAEQSEPAEFKEVTIDDQTHVRIPGLPKNDKP
jgi:hypothetical protein